MSETEHEQHERWRDDLAAYALGALDLGEAAELEQHLAGCESCCAELEWLRPAVRLLPESVERVEPSPQLRASLMEQVRSEARTERSRWSLRRPGGGWALRPLAGLAALVLVAAAIAGYAIGGGGSSSGTHETTAFSGHSPGVTAEVVSDGQSGTLHLANLHQLPPDKVLQAWVQRGKKVVSAKALFVPNSDGTATATIDDMQGVEAVMVTAEPRGGSVQPTSAPIAAVSMPG
jgi:anti-sigma-K factor RskA